MTTTSAPSVVNSFCDGIYCLSWIPNGDSVDFTFKANITKADNFWVAFALSNDAKMVKL